MTQHETKHSISKTKRAQNIDREVENYASFEFVRSSNQWELRSVECEESRYNLDWKLTSALQLLSQSFKVDSTKRDGLLSCNEDSPLVQMSWPPPSKSETKKSSEYKSHFRRVSRLQGEREQTFDESKEGRGRRQTLLDKAAKAVPCLGIILSLCASIFLGTAGMLVKMTSSVHGIQVAVFR